MAGREWEYCELTLSQWKKHSKGPFGGKEGWGYDCDIYYYSPTGDVIGRIISRIDRILPFNPFKKAMALLGAKGWELVGHLT
jgi:hypothetical protein